MDPEAFPELTLRLFPGAVRSAPPCRTAPTPSPGPLGSPHAWASGTLCFRIHAAPGQHRPGVQLAGLSSLMTVRTGETTQRRLKDKVLCQCHVNGLHLYSAFIQSAVQFMPLIQPFTHTFTHQRRLAAMQGTDQLVRSNRGLGVLLRDTSTRPGWDRTGNPPTARRQL